MATSTSMFNPKSVINLGTLVGIAAGLAVGMLGASALPQASRTSVSNTVQPTLLRNDQTLLNLQSGLDQESALLSDTLRLIGLNQDFRAASLALDGRRTQTSQSMQNFLGVGRTKTFRNNWTSVQEALIQYANQTKNNIASASTLLDESDSLIKDAAAAIVGGTKVSQSQVESILRQERDNWKGIADLSRQGKLAESYQRQTRVPAMNATLVTLINR